MNFARRRHIGILLTAVLLCGGFVEADGQNIARYRSALSLSNPSARTSVSVTEHGSAADAIRQYDNLSKPTKIPGYRIRIFFDNSQNARAEALEVQSRFKNEFPGIPTFLVYENPSYTVTVGNCADIDEALMLWNKVKRSFNMAFLWRGDIPIEELSANRFAIEEPSSLQNSAQ